mmetsp:Transcript_10730/g.33097  ORF Transcript_10730/g.33097 Transcript_10730/m.33097 type:complete len:208 (+) Transcript_10730:359-982(+)
MDRYQGLATRRDPRGATPRAVAGGHARDVYEDHRTRKLQRAARTERCGFSRRAHALPEPEAQVRRRRRRRRGAVGGLPRGRGAPAVELVGVGLPRDHGRRVHGRVAGGSPPQGAGQRIRPVALQVQAAWVAGRRARGGGARRSHGRGLQHAASSRARRESAGASQFEQLASIAQESRRCARALRAPFRGTGQGKHRTPSGRVLDCYR